MSDEGWTQYLVFRHEGILKDEALSAFTKELYASIISRSNGSWKPISVEIEETKLELNVSILKVKHTMVKNKTKQNISNDVFEMHQTRTAQNVAAIEKELKLAEMDLKFFEKEITLRKGKNSAVEPKFEYEKSYEWKQYIEEVTEYAHSQKLVEKKDKVARLQEGFVCETARLKLISEGVPAWEPNYDNTRLLNEYEKQNNPSSD